MEILGITFGWDWDVGWGFSFSDLDRDSDVGMEILEVKGGFGC